MSMTWWDVYLIKFLFILSIFLSLPVVAGERDRGEVFEKSIGRGPFPMTAVVSEIGNLSYHLDCLSGWIQCSEKSYQDLWKTKLNWSSDDDKALKEWSFIRQKYDQSIHFDSESLNKTGVRSRSDGIDYGKRLRAASYEARSMGDFSRRTSFFMTAPDAQKCTDILSRFYPRFHTWWATGAAKVMKRWTNRLADIVVKHRLDKMLGDVRVLYSSELKTTTEFRFLLIYKPREKGGDSRAECFDERSVIEVSEGENPSERVDVIWHEMFHYFYHTASFDNHLNLLQSFATSKEPAAVAAYNLLDESLATALGNGLVVERIQSPDDFKRYFAKPNSFYNNIHIDKMSKNTMSLIRERLSSGESIYESDFPSLWLKGYQEALAVDAMNPKVFLKNMFFAYDDQFKSADQLLTRGIKTNSVFSASPAASAEVINKAVKFNLQSGVILVSTNNVHTLEAWKSVIGDAALQDIHKIVSSRANPLVFGVRRDPKAYLFVIVASDPRQMNEAIGRFLAADRVFVGEL